MKEKVVVAMSGGVDSSVTAALLLEKGYEVIGITLQIWPADSPEGAEGGCCSLSAVEDARRVAFTLGIPHYVLNFRDAFETEVIEYFGQEYLQGRTPNPCIRCNKAIKFEGLLNKSLALGADKMATGHYARIVKNQTTGRYQLGMAKDLRKDQSYVLYNLTQQQLAHTLLPLGDYTKPEIREMAKAFNLSVASKPESQEICFIPDDNYRNFLQERYPQRTFPKGRFVDIKGKVLGEHQGIPYYTIGQRKGLGIALGYPAYVVALDLDHNNVILGKDDEVYAKNCLVGDLNWIDEVNLNEPIDVEAKIRSTHQPAKAKISFQLSKAAVVFDQPQRAVTPGQAIVFYQGEWVLGGGTIESVER